MSECPICLEDVIEERLVLIECCNMKFCVDCLVKWFNTIQEISCPICHDILDDYYIPITDSTNEENEDNLQTNYNKIKLLITWIILFICAKLIYSISIH